MRKRVEVLFVTDSSIFPSTVLSGTSVFDGIGLHVLPVIRFLLVPFPKTVSFMNYVPSALPPPMESLCLEGASL